MRRWSRLPIPWCVAMACAGPASTDLVDVPDDTAGVDASDPAADSAVESDLPDDTQAPDDSTADTQVATPLDLSGILEDLTVPWIADHGAGWLPFGTDERLVGSQGTPTLLCRSDGHLLAVMGGLVDRLDAPEVAVPVAELTAGGLVPRARLTDVDGGAFPLEGPTDAACVDLDGDGLPELVFSGGIVEDGRWLYRGAQGAVPWSGRVDGLPLPEAWGLTGVTNLTPARLRPGHLPDLLLTADGPDGWGRVIALVPVERGQGAARTVTWLPHAELVDPTGHLPSAYVLHTPTRQGADGRWVPWALALGDVPTTGSPELASGVFELLRAAPEQAGWALGSRRLVPRDPVPTSTPWSQRPGPQQGRSNLNLLSPMGARVLVHPAAGPALVVSTTFEASPFLGWGDPRQPSPSIWPVLSESGGRFGLPLVTFAGMPQEESYGRYWGLAGDAQALLVAMGRDQACRVEPCMEDAWLTPRLFWDGTGQGDYEDVTDQTVLAGLGGSWHAVTSALRDDGSQVHGLGSKYNTRAHAAWPRVLAERPVGGERFVGVRLVPHRSLPGGQGSWARLEAADGGTLGEALVDGSGTPSAYVAPDGVRFRVPPGRAAGRVCVTWWESGLEQCVDAGGAEGSVREVEEPVVLEVADEGPLRLGAAPGVWALEVRCPTGWTCAGLRIADLRFGSAPVLEPVAGGWTVSVTVPTRDEAAAQLGTADAGFAARWEEAFGTTFLGSLVLELELRDAAGVIWRRRLAPFLEAAP
ncbi:MAG: hypothetical protein H6732_04020 [Alphaproteobacteria bacterium]|nr:hypothetical protein [Alphaproteobacteria bacterium]